MISGFHLLLSPAGQQREVKEGRIFLFFLLVWGPGSGFLQRGGGGGCKWYINKVELNIQIYNHKDWNGGKKDF